MHELQVTERILDIILQKAKAHHVSKVISIQLQIGELSDLEEEWVQKYFDYLSKDTVAENAKVKIEKIPVIMQCNECGESFNVEIKQMKEIQCPACGQKACTLVSGKEYYIKDMEVT